MASGLKHPLGSERAGPKQKAHRPWKINGPIVCPNGRGERIRTSGLYVPNVALYQAKLHPDWCGNKRLLDFFVYFLSIQK